MGEAVAEAHRIAAETPGAVLLNQFANPANPEVHRRTTAPEIWEDTDGSVDIFVSAVGTGGTITGVGEVLKARNPAVRVVAVEPAGAAVLSGHPAGEHQIPGIGVGFIPEVLNRATAHAALNLAARPDAAGKTIGALLADTGDRDVTTALMTSA